MVMRFMSEGRGSKRQYYVGSVVMREMVPAEFLKQRENKFLQTRGLPFLALT